MAGVLKNQGSNVDIKDYRGDTALTLAARAGHSNVVHVLLEAGAKCDLRVS